MRVFSVFESRKGRRYGWHGGRRGAFFVMVKMKNDREEKQSIKEKGGREKEMRFESFILKSCESSNIRSLIKSIDIDLKCRFIFVSSLSSHFFSVSLLPLPSSPKHSTMMAAPSTLQHISLQMHICNI
jgi:hypothetical protein